MDNDKENVMQMEDNDIDSPKRSILTRIVMFSSLIVLITVGIFIIQLLPFERRVIFDNLKSKASDFSIFVKKEMIETNKLNSSMELHRICTNLVRNSQSIEYIIITHDNCSHVYTRDKFEKKELSKFWRSFMKHSVSSSLIKTDICKNKTFHYCTPVWNEKEFIGWIHLGFSLERYYSDLNSLNIQVFFNLIIAVFAGLILSYAFARRIKEPIQQLNDITKQIRNGQLDATVRINTGDELECLANSFNKMTERLNFSHKQIMSGHNYITNIIKALTHALFVISSEGIIKIVNPAGCSLLEYEAFELIGKEFGSLFSKTETENFMKLHDAEDTIPIRELILIFIYRSIVKIQEVTLNTQGNEGIPVLLSSSLIYDNDGHIDGTLIIAQDIRTIKHSEKEREKLVSRLNDSYDELQQFVYTISHDLKAPLVSLDGFTTLLLERNEEILDEKSLHYINRIRINISNMNNLMSHIFEVSRITQDSLPYDIIDIKDMVEDIGEQFAIEFSKFNIKYLTLDTYPDIIGIQYQIRQVFENLIYNAFNYRNDSQPVIEVGYTQSDQEGHVFYIRDNGIGIAKKNLDKIFEIFARIEDIESPGSGVGLTIVRKIVEHHGGKIWVESEKLKGSVFWFSIPLLEIDNTVKGE
ncbi:HAMP domain-containing protein [bacterium]|nr:HAMP domain-containing protein [bacterium]